MRDSDVKREIDRLTENLKAGAAIHEGDGGYGIGTKEKYEEFVRMRNYHYTNTNNPVDFPISAENMRARCEALIIAMVGKDMATKWWTSPNKAFGGDTPEHLYVYHPYVVYDYLMRSADGEW